MYALRRPSLDYQYLFDLCGLQAQRWGLPCLLRTPQQFFAYELVRRIMPIEFMPETDFAFPDIPAWITVERPEQGAFPVVRLADDNVWESGDRFKLVIWAEPTQEEAELLPSRLHRVLSGDGRLCVLFSRFMANALPEQKTGGLPKRSQHAGAKIPAVLRQANFRQVEQHSFHGPVSILWWQAARWLERMRKPDLADRCLNAMRAGYRATGWQVPLSTVTWLMAAP